VGEYWEAPDLESIGADLIRLKLPLFPDCSVRYLWKAKGTKKAIGECVKTSGLTGYFGAVRASPIFWRVHVFGDEGSAEALGENQLVLRTRGGKVEVRDFPKVDSILAELDAFADAVEGRAPYPIKPKEIVDVVAAFEAIIQSMDTKKPVSLQP